MLLQTKICRIPLGILFGFSFCALGITASAIAEEKDLWYASPLLGVLKPQVKNQWSQAALTSGFNADITPDYGLEIGVDRRRYRANLLLRTASWNNASLNSLFIDYERPYYLNRLFNLKDNSVLSDVQIAPGFGLGFGRFNNELNKAQASGIGFNISIGLSKPVFDQWHIFSSASYQYYDLEASTTNSEGNTHTLTFNNAILLELGARYYFSKLQSASIVIPVAEPVAMPAPILTPMPVESDSDSDGVKDSLDNCPSTVINAKVDAQGCELDSDSDGVRDSQDLCQNTIRGVSINDKGCAEFEGEIEGLNFKEGSSELTTASKNLLNKLSLSFVEYPNLKIEVQAYTDNKGNEMLNQMLSEDRAAVVVKYLVSRGLDKSRVSSRGFGETRPIADNNTEQGRAMNRRVEFMVLHNDK